MLADRRKTREEISCLNSILSNDTVDPDTVLSWYISSTNAKKFSTKRVFNILLDLSAVDQARDIFPEIMEDVNKETSILIIRYFLMCNKVDEAHEFFTSLDSSLTRKRHAHLMMSSYISTGCVEDAQKYFDVITERYILEASDITPFMVPSITTAIKHYVLSKAIGHPLKLEIPDLVPVYYSDLDSKPIKLDFTESQRDSLMSSMNEIFVVKGQVPKINLDIDYKFIIDGANVLFFADRKICLNGYRRITNMLTHLSCGRVLLVLHQRHFKPNGKFRSAAYGEIKKWEANSNVDICKTPFGFNDDYYSLINSFPRTDSYLITNDKFRDHIFKLSKKTHSLDLVAQWRQEKIIEYDIDHGNLVFKYPLNYSFRIQYIDGKYYVPNKAEGSKETLWYVI